MGYSPEQTVMIMNATVEAITKTQPREANWAWSLMLVLLPVVATFFLGIHTRNNVIKRNKELKERKK